jgi:hypothetical protein
LSNSNIELTAHFAKEALKKSSEALRISPQVLKGDLSNRMSTLRFDVSVRVKLYRRYSLDKPRSLEAFISKFGRRERLYDPTGAFDEAEHLVKFACELRRQLDRDLKAIYWNSRWRTTYVLLNEKAFADGFCLQLKKLIAAERALIEVYEASAGVLRNVRLCFDLPALPLVPVDEISFTNERVRKLTIPSLPQILEVARIARIPILSALLSLGSAGIAAAKLPTLENQPITAHAGVLTATPSVAARGSDGSTETYAVTPGDAANRLPSGSIHLFPGGPGLHLLWRDPIHGAVGRNASFAQPSFGKQLFEAKTKALIGSEEVVSRDFFLEVVNSGATFGASASPTRELRADLRWVAHGERDRGRANELTGPPESIAFPVMQPGVTALLGLSNLMGSDVPSEIYGTVINELQFHFGLPRSIQAEKRWMLAQSSYWEWLGVGPKIPPAVRRDNKGPRPSPPQCSSC